MAWPRTTERGRSEPAGPRWTLLTTRVGRRVFLLFVLSALIPVLGMGLVSYRNVSRHIRDLSEQRVRETAKAAGMAFIERVMAADGQLADYMDGRDRAGTPRGLSGGQSDMQGGRFLERVEVLQWPLGEGETGLDALDAGARERLEAGEPQLFLGGVDPTQSALRLLRLDAGNGSLYSADLRADSLLAASRIYAESLYGAGVCLILDPDRRVGCDEPIDAAFEAGSAPQTMERRGTWTWASGGEDYLVGYWTAFLSASFGAPAVVMAVAEHGEGLRVPAEAFSSAFLLAVALCMALVLAFSTLVIRRSLAPLERLKNAAQRLGRARYETRVEIDSGDEFEELADAFNGMAGRLTHQIGELRDLQVATIRALARAIDASSHWTRGHSERVAQLSVALGGEMDVDAEGLELMYRGGLLHDIGKIGVPAGVLDKDGSLTDEEFDLIRAHPMIGITILEPIAALAPLLPMVRSHHERLDG
ncbi:MAG: HAMP domain-containing protein, partial [Gemmatimonadota bacterium]|nr:HAMP domain-containing protein [Gemmatimonadota bacterium]